MLSIVTVSFHSVQVYKSEGQNCLIGIARQRINPGLKATITEVDLIE